MPDVLPTGEKLIEALQALRIERNAVILAHYYQEPEIQDLADFVGDSLQLSKEAASTDAEVILFCGVHFMAETAKILNPSRTVLLPDLKAGCSLADSCPADALAEWKSAHPEHLVVSYINCTAGTKALSDIICTSSNAHKSNSPASAKTPRAPRNTAGSSSWFGVGAAARRVAFGRHGPPTRAPPDDGATIELHQRQCLPRHEPA